MIPKPKLSPEILALIIDFLGAESQLDNSDNVGSWNALKACHQVSSAFRKRTIRHLFRRLEFRAREEEEGLLDIIENGDEEEYRHLAPYIKEFRYVLEEDDCEYLEDEHIPRLEVLFRRLSTSPFAISDVHFAFSDQSDLIWPSADEYDLEEAFIQLISSRSCRSVTMAHISDFPYHVIQAGGKGIKHIKLIDTYKAHVEVDSDDDDDYDIPKFKPRTIEVGNPLTALSIFCPGSTANSSLKSLRHLKFNALQNSLEHDIFWDIRNLLFLSGPSLKTLSMRFYSQVFTQMTPLDFSSSDGLQSITFDLYLEDRELRKSYVTHNKTQGSLVGFGAPLLDIPSPAKNLERISYQKARLLITAGPGASGIYIHDIYQDNLRSLSNVLTAENYPSLKSLFFHFSVSMIFWKDVAEQMFQERRLCLEDKVRSEFPELLARGVEIDMQFTMDKEGEGDRPGYFRFVMM